MPARKELGGGQLVPQTSRSCEEPSGYQGGEEFPDQLLNGNVRPQSPLIAPAFKQRMPRGPGLRHCHGQSADTASTETLARENAGEQSGFPLTPQVGQPSNELGKEMLGVCCREFERGVEAGPGGYFLPQTSGDVRGAALASWSPPATYFLGVVVRWEVSCFAHSRHHLRWWWLVSWWGSSPPSRPLVQDPFHLVCGGVARRRRSGARWCRFRSCGFVAVGVFVGRCWSWPGCVGGVWDGRPVTVERLREWRGVPVAGPSGVAITTRLRYAVRSRVPRAWMRQAAVRYAGSGSTTARAGLRRSPVPAGRTRSSAPTMTSTGWPGTRSTGTSSGCGRRSRASRNDWRLRAATPSPRRSARRGARRG